MILERQILASPCDQNISDIKIRHRVEGGGRKAKNEELENKLFNWIMSERLENRKVFRKGIQSQAIKIFESMDSIGSTTFKASAGWTNNFLRRYKISTDDKTKSKIVKNDSLSDMNFPNNVIKEEPIWDESYENYEIPLEPELELQEIKMEEN